MTTREPRGAGPAPSTPAGSRARQGIPAGLIVLGIALVASVAYVAYAITVRDTSQIPLLASGAVVLAIAFAALTVYCFAAVLRAGRDGRGVRALALAIVGGGAAIATASALAGALILFQLALS